MLPARAGLFPPAATNRRGCGRAPRACGAVPRQAFAQVAAGVCSPRVRGCSLVLGGIAREVRVLPARAGLFPSADWAAGWRAGAPRACGAVPLSPVVGNPLGTCSPRVRGCSQRGHHVGDHLQVLPARAGLFPTPSGRRRRRSRAPRACGAVPASSHASRTAFSVLPARAGLFPSEEMSSVRLTRAPRPCGAVPIGRFGFDAAVLCSPCACGAIPPRTCRYPRRAPCSPRVRGCSGSAGCRRPPTGICQSLGTGRHHRHTGFAFGLVRVARLGRGLAGPLAVEEAVLPDEVAAANGVEGQQ